MCPKPRSTESTQTQPVRVRTATLYSHFLYICALGAAVCIKLHQAASSCIKGRRRATIIGASLFVRFLFLTDEVPYGH